MTSTLSPRGIPQSEKYMGKNNFQVFQYDFLRPKPDGVSDNEEKGEKSLLEQVDDESHATRCWAPKPAALVQLVSHSSRPTQTALTRP